MSLAISDNLYLTEMPILVIILITAVRKLIAKAKDFQKEETR